MLDIGLIVRVATISDLEAVYSLICDLEDHNLDKKSFEATFSKNLSDIDVYYLVAEKDGRVVGFISMHVQHILHHQKATCELQELNIEPEMRGQGIGNDLMEEVERIAKSINVEEIELTTRIYRDKAQKFYRNLGYEHTHNKYVKKF